MELELIDFLKYGAIGITAVLAILSYRLLSKEQERDTVRKPILNTIKLFLLFSLFISIFYGAFEFVPSFINSQRQETEIVHEIWEKLPGNQPDSTVYQKIRRINSSLDMLNDTTRICAEIINELNICKDSLRQFDTGFYQNIIKLQQAINSDPDGWINLSFRPETKTHVIANLKEVFIILDGEDKNLTDEELIEHWRLYKSKWSESHHGYIFSSDIAQIVRLFLATYHQ